MGTVYERFLGKVIRLTAGHQAKVEEKPEVRKAGGVYYTPAYIVDYIVKNTVGKKADGRSPAQLAGGKNGQPFRVLDMACGSGSFLLGAYQFLLDHCLMWYQANPSPKHAKAVYQNAKGETCLTITERKRILTTHIFGVDIDRQAVETTKLSLLLKALEGENDTTLSQQMQLFHERALPNLSDNIKCGNSLIASDFSIIPEDLVRIHAFDWPTQFPDAIRAGGFDAIIGNPPYVLGRQTFDNAVKKYLSNYLSFGGKYDLYIYFTERAISLLRRQGRFGYILPNTILTNENAARLRDHILKQSCVETIKVFDSRVFEGAQVESIVLILSKEDNNIDQVVIVESDRTKTIPQRKFCKNIDSRFNLQTDTVNETLINKIIALSVPLGKISEICIGIQLGGSSGNITKEGFLSKKREDKTFKPVLDGRNINRYQLNWNNIFVRYGEWLHRKRDEKFFISPKLVIRQIGATPVMTYDDEQFYTLNTIYNLIGVSDYSLKYILGIINSKIGKWFWITMNSDFKGLFPKIKKSQIEVIPIRTINFLDDAEKVLHGRLVGLVEKMLVLTPKLCGAISESEKTALQNAITTTDAEIDRLVYELYGLTEEEIKIVEGEC